MYILLTFDYHATYRFLVYYYTVSLSSFVYLKIYLFVQIIFYIILALKSLRQR